MKLLTAFMSLMFLAGAAPAIASGNGAGNGGEVVLENGKYYLFDLVEKGIHLEAEQLLSHLTPLPDIATCRGYRSFNEALLKVEPAEVRDAIREPLLAMVCAGHPIAPQLVLASQKYEFAIVNEQFNPVFTGASTIDRERILAAVRHRGQILFRSAIWSRLDPTQKFALVAHELIYSLVAPEWLQDRQDPVTARSIVGSLFSDKLHINPEASSMRDEYSDVVFDNVSTELRFNPQLNLVAFDRRYEGKFRNQEISILDPAMESMIKTFCSSIPPKARFSISFAAGSNRRGGYLRAIGHGERVERWLDVSDRFRFSEELTAPTLYMNEKNSTLRCTRAAMDLAKKMELSYR